MKMNIDILKTWRKEWFFFRWCRGRQLLFRTKSIHRLLLRKYFDSPDSITGFKFEESSGLLTYEFEKSSSHSNRQFSTLLWSKPSIHFQVNRNVDNHNLRFCLSYRFRPFGLFRKSTHSSIGEIDQTWESV